MSIEASQFYNNEASLYTYIDGLRQGPVARIPGPAKAKKQFKNPILPDGTVKRGRPRKAAATPGAEQETPTKAKSGRGKKRKRGDDDVGEVVVEARPQPTLKRKRGGSSKQQPQSEHPEPSTAVQGVLDDGGASASKTRKRGRPPKRKPSEIAAEDEALLTSGENLVATPPAPKRRGRHRKHPLSSDTANATAVPTQTAEDGSAPVREGDMPVGPTLSDHDPPTETTITEATQEREDHITAESSENTPKETELPAIAIDANAALSSTLGAQIRIQPTENTVPPQGTDSGIPTGPGDHHAIPEPAKAYPAIPNTFSGHEQLAGIAPERVVTVPHVPKPSHLDVPIDPTLLSEFSDNGAIAANDGLAGVRAWIVMHLLHC